MILICTVVLLAALGIFVVVCLYVMSMFAIRNNELRNELQDIKRQQQEQRKDDPAGRTED